MELDNVIKKSTLDVVFCGSSDSDISNNGTKENCAISSVIEKLYLMNGTEQTTDCQNILNNLNNNNNNNNNNTNAKKRWKILAKAIVKQRHDEKNRNSYASDSCGDEADKIGSDCIQASVRRFTSFDLVKFEHIANYEKDQLLGCPDNWYSYKIEMNPNECYTVNIHQANRPLTATDLMGFNNTGNICVWPSEEALAIVVLSELDSFTQKSVLELGGGMTCLAGLFLAKYGCTDLVLLTDGNSNSVENVRRTIRLNEANCYIRTMVLEWGRSNDFLWHTSENKFHYILSADCLFFDETRTDLIETIWHFLTVDGIAFVMAPQRGSTLDLFVTEAQQYGFDCLVSYRYNDIIWTDYWKSNERKYCDFCKCWIADNKPSIAFHENGKKHQANVAKRISDISRQSAKDEKSKAKVDKQIRQMEDAAMRAYALDISRSGDLTCQALNSEANIVDSTNDNVISTTSSVPGPAALPRRAIDPLLPPIDILEEEERMKRERMKQKNISANSPYSVAPSTVEGSMWCEAKSEEGYPYYWNVKTGDTIWEAPKEGYMTLEEYNRINKIAVAKQEQELKNESLFMQKNADEIAAKFQREQMKRLRPITTIKTEGEGNDATIENENFDEPGWSAKPLGQWQTVVKKEEKKIDLQLPKVNHNFVYVPTSVTDAPPIKKFKEKTVTTLDYGETAFTSGSFKKRRLPGKNNTRQRTDDD